MSSHLNLASSSRPGVSTDSAYSHFAWASQARNQGGLGPSLKLPLIADRNMKISSDYGVLLEDEGIALRGLFIIDPQGVLRQITVNDLPVGRSVDETVRLIQAFQFVVRVVVVICPCVIVSQATQEKHGEVCPANWKAGEKTMKADPKGSLEYFSTVNPNGTDGARKRPRLD